MLYASKIMKDAEDNTKKQLVNIINTRDLWEFCFL